LGLKEDRLKKVNEQWNSQCPICRSKGSLEIRGFLSDVIVCNACLAEWVIELSLLGKIKGARLKNVGREGLSLRKLTSRWDRFNTFPLEWWLRIPELAKAEDGITAQHVRSLILAEQPQWWKVRKCKVCGHIIPLKKVTREEMVLEGAKDIFDTVSNLSIFVLLPIPYILYKGVKSSFGTPEFQCPKCGSTKYQDFYQLRKAEEEVVPHTTTSKIPELIKQLAELRDHGILSEEEFTKQKQKLLNKM